MLLVCEVMYLSLRTSSSPSAFLVCSPSVCFLGSPSRGGLPPLTAMESAIPACGAKEKLLTLARQVSAQKASNLIQGNEVPSATMEDYTPLFNLLPKVIVSTNLAKCIMKIFPLSSTEL